MTNQYVTEMNAILESDEDSLEHYGMPRRSGRYPWGSGDNPYQHSSVSISSRYDGYKKQGLSDPQIAKLMGYKSSTILRSAVAIDKNNIRSEKAERVQKLHDEDGKGWTEIGKTLGVNESTARSLYNQQAKENSERAKKIADNLEKKIQEKGYIDVGEGVEREVGASRTKMDQALADLQFRGYNLINVQVPQASDPSKKTTIKVLAKKGDIDEQRQALYKDPEKIKSLKDYIPEDARMGKSILPPTSIKSSRVMINYSDTGNGGEKDGLIEIRRGVPDLDLGNSSYAQVRIMVDGKNYIKGMAVYADDDLPKGVDIRFNTNKTSKTPKTGKNGVLKPIKEDDPLNPFGAYIPPDGQSFYTDKSGRKRLSPINKLRSEGDWGEQSKTLSSQFLSKQPEHFIKKQLRYTYQDYENELAEINSYTNPVIKKKMLLSFADKCDSASVHMKAAALPRQQTKVLIPIPELGSNEVYAPDYRDGEKVCLVRYPHGGIFEIPELRVTNKTPAARKAKRIMGTSLDAIGINSKVAQQLSGADFDGDTVIVIPTNSRVHIKTAPMLEQLKGFEPKTAYPYHEGMKVLKKGKATQQAMGTVSNLITDMTLKGASSDEISRAVKHSMVVIDAAKHKLDYQQSYKDNGIAELKRKYQTHYSEEDGKMHQGASTLISKRNKKIKVPATQGSGRIDPDTGRVIYKQSGKMRYSKKEGKMVPVYKEVPLLSTYDDLHRLSSGSPAEEAYADYGNKLKALANTARKEYVRTPLLKKNPAASKTYASEVASLESKLNMAAKQAPKKRRAQSIAKSKISAIVSEYPYLTDPDHKKEYNKIKSNAADEARAAIGLKKEDSIIRITDREWEAIQAGAVSDNKAREILRYTDDADIVQRALPRTNGSLSDTKKNKINLMRGSGSYTVAEIADAIGVSPSTVNRYLAEGK